MINNCKNRNSQDSQRPMIHKYKKKGTREYNFSLFSGPAKQMISHCCDEPSNRFVLTNVSVEPIAIRGCFMRKQAPVFLFPLDFLFADCVADPNLLIASVKKKDPFYVQLSCRIFMIIINYERMSYILNPI